MIAFCVTFLRRLVSSMPARCPKSLTTAVSGGWWFFYFTGRPPGAETVRT